MHVQKNVFETLIATLMDIGKSKDGLKSWKEMVQLNVMPQLHPVPEANGKYTLSAACFNPTPDEIVFDFNDMQTCFHLEAIEMNLIRMWCL